MFDVLGKGGKLINSTNFDTALNITVKEKFLKVIFVFNGRMNARTDGWLYLRMLCKVSLVNDYCDLQRDSHPRTWDRETC